MMQIELLPHQYSLVEDAESPVISCVAGLGSGKTTGAIYKALHLAAINPSHVPGVILLPTFPMARDVARPAMDEALERLQVPYEFHRSDFNYFINLNGARREIRIRNGESGHRLAGSNLGWAVIDEAGQQKDDVVKMIAARVRHPDATHRQLVLCGTPEGMDNSFYHISTDRGTRLIKARTTDNTFLGEGYMRYLSYLSDEEKERYINGEFIPLSGSCYKVPEENIRHCDSPTLGRVYLCCDFNISTMAWVLAVERKGTLHCFSEIVGENRNTLEMAEISLGHLASFGLTPGDVTVVCDAAGAARQTSASYSDTIILRQHGYQVQHPAKNPPIKDRVYSVASMLKQGRLLFDPNGAPNVLAAFQQQGLDKYGLPDKTTGHDHFTDAVGYCVHHLKPIQMPRANGPVFYH